MVPRIRRIRGPAVGCPVRRIGESAQVDLAQSLLDSAFGDRVLSMIPGVLRSTQPLASNPGIRLLTQPVA